MPQNDKNIPQIISTMVLHNGVSLQPKDRELGIRFAPSTVIDRNQPHCPRADIGVLIPNGYNLSEQEIKQIARENLKIYLNQLLEMVDDDKSWDECRISLPHVGLGLSFD